MKRLLVLIMGIAVSLPAQSKEKYGNLLNCPVIDMTDGLEKGQSFLNLIQDKIKPDLDKFAEQGYPVADGDRLVEALEQVDGKVQWQVMRSLKGKNRKEKKENLQKIGDELFEQKATLYSLPNMIAKTGLAKNRYKLSTYVGLVSCGGSHLKLADDNYAYNVHYGTGSQEKDKQTGRSFGASRVFRATDSSYTHYLKTLKNYVRQSPSNVKHFVKTIVETLTNSDPRGYQKVNNNGDAVLTDFFAIWTAEQTRNLMDGRVDLHWDAALLQVTLLAAFHAGQDEIKMFYRDPLSNKVYFTDTTYELAWPKKNHKEEKCEVDLETRKVKPATLEDYIAVHYRTYEHCGRSGINSSKREWKKLSQEITQFLMASEEGSSLVEEYRSHLEPVVDFSKNERGRKYRKPDVFRELSRYIINDSTPSLVNHWQELSQETVRLMEFVRKNAKAITSEIEKKYPQGIE